MSFYAVLCYKCHKYFPMKAIKGDNKMCSFCGETIRLSESRMRATETMIQAKEIVVVLNKKSSVTKNDSISALDLIDGYRDEE